MSNDWNSLNVREKIMLVSTDILQLLDTLCEKTKPGGELDSVIDSASESFKPLGELLQINWEEQTDRSISIKTLSQLILSGRSILTPEVAQLLGSSFKPAARNAEENEDIKSVSTSHESGQIDRSSKRIDELLDSRDNRRRRHSVIENVISRHNPEKDLTQPGPSGLQRRKDVSVRERFLERSLRGSSISSGTLSEHTNEGKHPREHSENLHQPGPSGERVFSTRAAASPRKNKGKYVRGSSQSEQVNYGGSKRMELQTQLKLSDVETKQKNVSIREMFMNQSVRVLHEPGSSDTSSEEITDREERQSRQLSKDVSQPSPRRVHTSSKQAARILEEIEWNKRLSRSPREQTQIGHSDTQTKRKDDVTREEFPTKSFRSVSQPRPDVTSSVATSEERQPRHRSEESSRPDTGERSEGFRKQMLPKESSVDRSETIRSKRKKNRSDSKLTRSSSVYKSYTHFDPDDWERDSDEYENDHGRSSTIY